MAIHGSNMTVNNTTNVNGPPFVISAPAARTIALGTAYQATDPTSPSTITVTLSSTAGLTLAGGTTTSADIVIGTTAAIATTGGTTVAKYSNGLTGTLVIGLAINAVQTTPVTIFIPLGWYFAIRQTAGTVTIVSAYEQEAATS